MYMYVIRQGIITLIQPSYCEEKQYIRGTVTECNLLLFLVTLLNLAPTATHYSPSEGHFFLRDFLE